MFPAHPAQDQPQADVASLTDTASWKLEDAKARFSEVVRLAESGVPQHVSVRGRAAVVILGAADYARLAPAANSGSLASLFADSPFARLDDFDDLLVRERSPVRDAPHVRTVTLPTPRGWLIDTNVVTRNTADFEHAGVRILNPWLQAA